LQPNKTNDIKKATSNFAMIFLKKRIQIEFERIISLR